MIKFYLEEPSLLRKNDVINYMNEHKDYGSDVNGSGWFEHILYGESYEECLDKVKKMADIKYAKSVNRCPGKTFFLIRKNDNRLIGMINIRHHLTKAILKFGGHIGYGIRPTERRKGYSEINLYLGLIKAYEEFGLKKVMLDCSIENLASDKTIKALDGKLERCELDESDNTMTNVYWIDTIHTIKKYNDKYSEQI